MKYKCSISQRPLTYPHSIGFSQTFHSLQKYKIVYYVTVFTNQYRRPKPIERRLELNCVY